MPTNPAPPDPVVGLVLSGGGARSSFQVGALRYLYDEVGITPSVITGTSAGSILGTVLAQDADHDGQRARLDQLETLLRDLHDTSDMFAELPWFARLRERGPVWMEALDRRKRRQGALGRSFKRVADLRHGTATADDDTDPPAAGQDRTADAAEDAENDHAPQSAGVTERAEEVTTAVVAGIATGGGASDPPPRGPGAAARSAEPEVRGDSGWVPAKLVESIDTLRTVGRARADLAEIIDGAQRERSMFRPGPLADQLNDPKVFDPAAVERSGVTLRVSVVSLETGELRYVTERGTLVDRENRPIEDGTTVELARAVHASCAIPAVFPPVRLGAENYVDGGVRESLPADIALTHLGVDECYAVVAGPTGGLPREDSYDDKDMLAIVLRTTTMIMTDEVQRDEVVHAKARGALVVEPEFDVHDTLTVDPGLVAIAIDYGYLRAAEAHQRAGEEDQAVTRDLILLRRRIWWDEEEAFGPDAPELDGAERLQRVAAIAGLKYELRDLIRRVPAARLPEHAGGWWRSWEAHQFDVPVSPTWTAR